ncbi:MAG: molybdenum cofactor guanylyltransferase [Bacteroidetes bacterium]|nr:molybdenum cofactor guanylyltransferase [Bacteroidota bacterium]
MSFLHSCTAFILAGGKSSRMGKDKGLILIEGKEMIVLMIELLKPHFKEVRIITNNPEYAKFNLTIHTDIFLDQGPLAGIYAGLTFSETPWNFFIACDMPFMNIEIIQKLAVDAESFDIVVPFHNNHSEPLCAFYNTTCLTVIEHQLHKGENKIQNIFKLVKTKEVEFGEVDSSTRNPFLNINT